MLLSIKYYSIIFLIVSFIFLSDLKFDYFQFRFLILLLLLPSIYKIYLDLKKKKFNFLISFFLLSAFFFFQTAINVYFEETNLTRHSFFGHIFLLLIFIISYYYFEFINKNIYSIIRVFIFIFFSSCVYSLFNYHPDAPFYCGGIPYFVSTKYLINTYGEEVINIYLEMDAINNFRLSFKELIFLENSHLGMIAPSIIIFLVYRLSSKKVSVLETISTFLFIIICFIKSSTTFFLGTVLSIILIIFFNHKFFDKRIFISFFVLMLLCISILIFDKDCRSRFVPTYTSSTSISNVGTNYENDLVAGGINKNLAYKIKSILKTGGSLTSAIFFHSLKIAKNSIFEKPFGWGLNRYEVAFDHYNKLDPSSIKILNTYNNKDGASNFNKLIVEFGIFGIFFYFLIFLFILNKSIPFELKLFYFPFIVTQSIRGAGYFNGGFALIFFLLLFTYLNTYKKL